MAKLTVSLALQSWSLEATAEDIKFLIEAILKWAREDSTYIDYRISTAEASYAKSDIRWLELSTSRGILKSPYELVVDYRNFSDKNAWGSFLISGNFNFPLELAPHREEVKNRMEKEGKLGKGNNPAPRISRMELSPDGTPIYTMEQAFYYDQVGTNLSIDYQLSKPIFVNGIKCENVRQWDITQASGVNTLPPLDISRLANTIGIAVGITAETEKGKSVILKRKRANTVAVYPGMMGVPFSFALAIEHSEKARTGKLEELINFDYGHELGQELLGLEQADFHPITLLAFCRDLIRGGKPQFFFEMKAKLSFEEIQRRVQSGGGEFKGKIEKLQMNSYSEDSNLGYSPELVAFAILKSSNS